MFTGIVEELGRIVRVPSPGRAGQLEIAATRVLAGTNVGDSIAVNGVCLTATTVSATGFTADVMPQTLAHSNLGALRAGSPVNLERAMAADGRFGGHIVSGHVDGIGQVTQFAPVGESWALHILAPRELARYLAYKGSVTVNGVSLTVNQVGDQPGGCEIRINLIPHTVQNTALHTLTAGSAVNLEIDLIARYVERMLSSACPESARSY